MPKYCRLCGKKLVKVEKEYYFDSQTGKKKELYKLQCPDFVNFAESSVLVGNNGHTRWSPLGDIKGIWCKSE